MTFLELVRDLARETGTLAGGVNLSTVISVNGRADKLVNWVQSAWTNIQNDQRDWLWMRREFTGTISAGASRFTPASFDLDRVAEWRGDWDRPSMWMYDPLIGSSDAANILQIDYDEWRYRYAHRPGDMNRPSVWAISPQNELVFGPTPVRDYTISGEYQATPQILVEDNDIPEMPVRFHKLITLEAARLLNLADGAYDAMQAVAQEVVTLREQLKREQLEPIRDASGSIG